MTLTAQEKNIIEMERPRFEDYMTKRGFRPHKLRRSPLFDFYQDEETGHTWSVWIEKALYDYKRQVEQ